MSACVELSHMCTTDRPTQANCLYITAYDMCPCKCLGQSAPGQLELIGKSRTSNLLGSHPAVCKLFEPTQHSHMPAQSVLNGSTQANGTSITLHKMCPCKCWGTIAFPLLWENSSSNYLCQHGSIDCMFKCLKWARASTRVAVGSDDSEH